jgi:hypothetical protein
MFGFDILLKKYEKKVIVDNDLYQDNENNIEKIDDNIRKMQFTLNTLVSETKILKTIAKPEMISTVN